MKTYRAISQIKRHEYDAFFRYEATVQIQIYGLGGIVKGDGRVDYFITKFMAKRWCRRTAKKLIRLYEEPSVLWTDSFDYEVPE